MGDELRRLSQHIVQASIYLANGHQAKAHAEISAAHDLVPALSRESTGLDAERLGIAMWGMDFLEAHRDVMAFAGRVAVEYDRLHSLPDREPE